MKRFLLVLGISACSSQTDATVEQHPEHGAVVAAAEQALVAISNEDTTALRAIMTENGTFYAIAGDSALRMTDVDFQVARFATGPDYLERMWDPEVKISGRLAMVWTPYDFYIDQEFSHCGIDVFHMAKLGNTWRVASIAFTRETENCPDSPLGPPSF